MLRDMCADMKMEEGYMRMSIEYNNDESRFKIQKAIAKVEKEMNIFPSVIRRSVTGHAGNFSIEFSGDGLPREDGEFCEAVIKELGIKACAV